MNKLSSSHEEDSVGVIPQVSDEEIEAQIG